MSADKIQNKYTKKLKSAGKVRIHHHGELSGFELSRLQNFIEGRQDIFDVLEHHAANNKEEELKDPKPAAPLFEPEPETMRDVLHSMGRELNRLVAYQTSHVKEFLRGIRKSIT